MTISPQSDVARMTVGVTAEGLCIAFRTALLLTGEVLRAETAMAFAIRSLNSGQILDEALLLGTLKAAVSSSKDCELRSEPPSLPLALRCVLRLATDHRHCFVLRVLVGLSRDECSRLLSRATDQIDVDTAGALEELARLRLEENAGSALA
jgi:hypothetical protein